MFSNFENFAGSQQDQLAQPPGQPASVSPNKKSKIEIKYADWGKPININNLNNSQVPPPLEQQVLPTQNQPQVLPPQTQPQVPQQITPLFQMPPPP